MRADSDDFTQARQAIHSIELRARIGDESAIDELRRLGLDCAGELMYLGVSGDDKIRAATRNVASKRLSWPIWWMAMRDGRKDEYDPVKLTSEIGLGSEAGIDLGGSPGKGRRFDATATTGFTFHILEFLKRASKEGGTEPWQIAAQKLPPLSRDHKCVSQWVKAAMLYCEARKPSIPEAIMNRAKKRGYSGDTALEEALEEAVERLVPG